MPSSDWPSSTPAQLLFGRCFFPLAVSTLPGRVHAAKDSRGHRPRSCSYATLFWIFWMLLMHVECCQELGWSLSKAGQHPEAERALQTALDLEVCPFPLSNLPTTPARQTASTDLPRAGTAGRGAAVGNVGDISRGDAACTRVRKCDSGLSRETASGTGGQGRSGSGRRGGGVRRNCSCRVEARLVLKSNEMP